MRLEWRPVTFNDYFAYAHTRNISTDGETIANNTVAWSEGYRAFRINDASTSVTGALIRPIGWRASGDVVTIRAEVMNLSGTAAKISLESDTAYSGSKTIGRLQTARQGEFEWIEATLTCPIEANYSVYVGLFSTDIGDFYVRNITVSVNAQRANPDFNGKAIKAYRFQVSGGAFATDPLYGPDVCTFSVSEPNKTLTVTHAITAYAYTRFQSDMLGLAWTSTSAENTNAKYLAKIKSESPTGVVVQFFDSTTGLIVAPSVILAEPAFAFSVFHLGFVY